MTSTQIALVGLISTFVIGLVRLLLNRRDLTKRKSFVNEYLGKFSEFVGKRDFDSETYIWLTQKVVAIQEELGQFGVMSYEPPAAGYMIHGHQVVLNFLPEIRQAKMGRYLSGPSRNDAEKAAVVGDCLVRYIGVLDTWLDESANELRNPLMWLREGVQSVLLLPIFILHWLGLIGSSLIKKIENSSIVRVISGLIAFVTLLSGVVTIFVGWNEFTRLVIQLWQTLF